MLDRRLQAIRVNPIRSRQKNGLALLCVIFSMISGALSTAALIKVNSRAGSQVTIESQFVDQSIAVFGGQTMPDTFAILESWFGTSRRVPGTER